MAIRHADPSAREHPAEGALPQGRHVLEFAREYRDRGWSVLPLVGKEPALRRWKDLQSRIPTERELLDWFAERDVNLGIVTGRISGLVVVDCDAQRDALWWVENHTVSPLTVETGGAGLHLYYQWPEGTYIGNRSRLFQRAIDLRGEGGYVVAPASRHPATGKVYRWQRDTPESCCDLPVFDPAWLADSSEQAAEDWARSARPRRADAMTAPMGSRRTVSRIRELIRHLNKDVDDRSRRDFAVVCGLLRLGVSPAEIHRLVRYSSKFAGNDNYFHLTLQQASKAVGR